ncbi:MAG: hypothetical protein SFW35_00460 [Chitinophagales bacterium]|nr:hypothetical protein [Chitinophagales bacterium]
MHLISSLLLFFVFSPMLAYCQAPFSGEQWITLLGKRQATAEASKLLSFIGDNGNPKGIKAIIQDQVITRIEFYNDDNPWGDDIQQFKGMLPKGLSITGTIADAKKKLGDGFEAEGEVSEIYILHKNFELTNVDAYQVSMEFRSGRLTVVTLIYLPGEAAKFDQQGNEVKQGLSGEDMIDLIKKNQYSKILEDLTNAIGPANHEERYLKVFAASGVEVAFGQDMNISRVVFYSGGQATPKGHVPNYGKFVLQLPYGIKFGDSQADVVSKAGPAAGEENGTMYYNDSYTRIFVHFDGGKVSKVELAENKDFKILIPESKPKQPVKKPN